MSVCPICDTDYKNLGQHWNLGCRHPEISDYQHEILTGVLLGDGSVKCIGRNPMMKVNMITEEFLKWLDRELEWLTTEVRKRDTLESGSKDYILRTRTHPELERYYDWYSTGNKEFPEDLTLTPLIAKIWYCGDGFLDRRNGGCRPRAIISAHNERNRPKFLKSLFDDIVDSKIGFYSGESSGTKLNFGANGTEDFIDYIGGPLPGFEYKWPNYPPKQT